MMKSHVWIFLLISISTFIDATSNESTSAAVKFISSPSALTRESSTDSSGILIRKNMLSSNMSSALIVTTPQSIPPTQSSLGYFANVHNQELRRYKSVLLEDPSKTKRSLVNLLERDVPMHPDCESFSLGSETSKSFNSPGYPGHYTKNISCVRVLTAPSGYLLKLDFRDHFNIEPSDDCKFDYLEIRDGAHGFSTSLGKYCGHNFPDIITSKDRYLWLHFHSDENIEYEGFKAVYEFIPRPTSAVYDDSECGETFSEFEGFVNSTFISREKSDYVMKHNLQLDCMWVIEVEKDWKIQLSFLVFKLEKPNDCDHNFVDVFGENTDIPSRLKNFCGSIADSVQSKTNIVHIRYFAEAVAINSSFAILYTAFRDKGTKENCRKDEYDCEDQTCIKQELKCNGNVNCRFRWDEDTEKCGLEEKQSEHMFIIVLVFGVMLTVMVIAFIVNCMRKIMRDHKIIRAHIRQSRESKLDELGRHSTKLTKSRENIAMSQLTKLPPPAFDLDSPTSINLIDNNASNHYYREAMPDTNGARNLDSKNDLHLREQEIKNIVGWAYDDDRKDGGEMCDMACQTRESLFQPVFKNKVTQSPMPSGLRFSTFGYLDAASSPSPPPCPAHSQASKGTMPHSHQHHHHFHHIHSNANQSSSDGIDKGTGTNDRMEEFQTTIDNDDKQKKFILKKDEAQARSYSDVRKSAPDVIIIAGCTSSH